MARVEGRHGWAWLAGLALFLLSANASAQQITSQQVLVQGSVPGIEAAEAAFAPGAPTLLDGQVLDMRAGRSAWIRITWEPARKRASLDIPVPLLDLVELYQRDAQGRWTKQAAGDSIAVARWPTPGRYPGFDLLPHPAPAVAYLHVRHADPIGFKLRLDSSDRVEQRRQLESLAVGAVLGCLLLLAASCLIQAAIHRDMHYAWYAAYATAMTLTMATITGTAGHVLWDESPRWADAAQGSLPVALAGVHVLFLRHLCRISPRQPILSATAMLLGVALLLLGLLYPWLGPGLQGIVVSIGLPAGTGMGFLLAAAAWRRHDPVAPWIFVAYVPLAAAVVVAMLRLHGLISATWLTLDASALAAAMAVPLLLVALSMRSQDWRSVQTRVNKLTQQDALTGLLSPAAFRSELDGAVSGALMRRDAAAIVLIEIANLDLIRKVHGDAVAEQSLLRAVIKLHRFVRESDPAGRVDTGRFAVILEGVSNRGAVQERMVRLVASGLVPARGAHVEVPLKFLVACVVLSEGVRPAAMLMRDLDTLLGQMHADSRKPVRFLEPLRDAGGERRRGRREAAHSH